MRHASRKTAALLTASWCALAPMCAATPRDPASELSRRSGLPPDEVGRLLADCSADQQSITFCAWRDQIAADDSLDEQTARFGASGSACRAAVTRQVAAWRQIRDKRCSAAARSEFGGGSAESAARLQCSADRTKSYVTTFKAPAACGR